MIFLFTPLYGLYPYGTAVISDVYEIFYDKGNVDPFFFEKLIKQPNFINRLLRYRQGALYGQYRIYAEEFSNLNIFIPSCEEQQKIGNFFKALDERISLQEEKIELLKSKKKGFLQKMFPKNGDRVPEVRFDGFSGEWEEKKFNQILEEFSMKSSVINEHIVLSSTNTGMEIRNGRVSGESNKGYKIIDNNDLVLSPQNLWLGNININRIGPGLVSPSYKTFKITRIEPLFLEPQLRSKQMLHEYKNSSTQGASVVRRNLDTELFNEIPIMTPELEEQQKIGEFFKHLDDTIALHEEKLEVLKETKKGFLQKMFV